MGVFEHFPYTNFHDLNLDKVLERTHEAEQAAAASAADAAASAADAAASHAEASAALNKANQAYNIASTANTNATYAKDKVDLGVQYEVMYDDNNSTITLTDLYTDTVLSTENDPMSNIAVANLLFGVSGNNPPTTDAAYCYPNTELQPKVKLVWLGAATTKWMAIATAAYKGVAPELHFSFYDPQEHRPAAITFKNVNGNNFIFANAFYNITGLPEVDASDNGKVLKVVNGKWTEAGLPDPNFTMDDNGDIPVSWASLKSYLTYSNVLPTIRVVDSNDPLHVRSGVLGELTYNSGTQTYYANFIVISSGSVDAMLFYSSDQTGDMHLD